MVPATLCLLGSGWLKPNAQALGLQPTSLFSQLAEVTLPEDHPLLSKALRPSPGPSPHRNLGSGHQLLPAGGQWASIQM